MSKFQVGEQVKIIEDLESLAVNKFDENGIGVNSLMLEEAGKIRTVREITFNGNYRLMGDEGNWHWTDEMLEKIEDSFIFDIDYLIENNENKKYLYETRDAYIYGYKEIDFGDYYVDLKDKTWLGDEGYDIMKIYEKIEDGYKLVWTRQDIYTKEDANRELSNSIIESFWDINKDNIELDGCYSRNELEKIIEIMNKIEEE